MDLPSLKKWTRMQNATTKKINSSRQTLEFNIHVQCTIKWLRRNEMKRRLAFAFVCDKSEGFQSHRKANIWFVFHTHTHTIPADLHSRCKWKWIWRSEVQSKCFETVRSTQTRNTGVYFFSVGVHDVWVLSMAVSMPFQYFSFHLKT